MQSKTCRSVVNRGRGLAGAAGWAQLVMAVGVASATSHFRSAVFRQQLPASCESGGLRLQCATAEGEVLDKLSSPRCCDERSVVHVFLQQLDHSGLLANASDPRGQAWQRGADGEQ